MPDGPASMAVVKRSLTIAGHRTSISLEDAFWNGLRSIAAREAATLASLVADIDRGRGAANLSSAIRVFVLDNLHRRGGPHQNGPLTETSRSATETA